MQLFEIDAGDHVEHYEQHGWVHVRSAVTDDFLAHLRATFSRRDQLSLAVKEIRGDKHQFTYDLPPDTDLVGELRDLTAKLCGLEPERFVLSERQIKVYTDDAELSPTAHKDRLASQVSVGVAIEVPEGSYVELYPAVERDVNPHLTPGLNQSLPASEFPDVTLRGKPSVKICDQPGDIIVFPGSTVWHRRCNSANTVNLYLKCNDFDCDPLASDPSTSARQRATARSLREPRRLDNMVPVLSRQLEWTGHITCRDGTKRAVAKLWDTPFSVISEGQLKLLEALSSGATGYGTVDTNEAIFDLAARGIIDLVGC